MKIFYGLELLTMMLQKSGHLLKHLSTTRVGTFWSKDICEDPFCSRTSREDFLWARAYHDDSLRVKIFREEFF